MSLLAYNLTGAPVVLAGGFATLPASSSPPNPNVAMNVSTVLKGLTGPQYAALEAQRPATVLYAWTDKPEFDVGTLIVVRSVQSTDGSLPTHGTDHDGDGSDPIPVATPTVSGLESAADKTKLDGIEAGADVTDFGNVSAALAAASTDIDVNAQNITDLADPTDEESQDAATALWAARTALDYWKRPARAAEVLNQLPLPNGGGMYGGVTVVDGDIIFVITHSGVPSASGPWVVNTAGFWTRPFWFDTGDHANSRVIRIADGTNAGRVYVCTTLPPNDVVDTDTLVWNPLIIGGRLSGGSTIFDDPAGAGIRCANPEVYFTTFGVDRMSIRAFGGGYPQFVAWQEYSYIGDYFPYYFAIGEATVRQYGTKQQDNPAALATPVINTVAAVGANNGVTRGYRIVAYDDPGIALAGQYDYATSTARSAEVTDANGATVQNITDYELISWTDVPGAVAYRVYLTFSSIGETLGLVGIVPQGVGSFPHVGQIGDGSSPPTLRTMGVNTYNGAFQTITLTENIALKITDGGAGYPTSGSGNLRGQIMRLQFKQGAGAPWTVTKPANVKASGGAIATSAGVGAIDLYTFVWNENESAWLEVSRALGVS